LAGFRAALTRTINQYIEETGAAKKDKVATSGDDAREGLIAVLSVKVPDPKFSSQTKDKLVSRKPVVERLATACATSLENPAEASHHSWVVEAAGPEAARKARQDARGRAGHCQVARQVVNCQKKIQPYQNYSWWSDSAGGSAKQGVTRFRIAAEGKIPMLKKPDLTRCWRRPRRHADHSPRLRIGRDEFDADKLRYHRIIIMTDADVDGSHIRTLLLTFFYRQMHELIERGHIYIGQPPLYKIKQGKQEQYLKDDAELNDYLLARALDDAALQFDPESPPLKAGALEQLMRDFMAVSQANARLAQGMTPISVSN
jgi:DNA gyrase subunit B